MCSPWDEWTEPSRSCCAQASPARRAAAHAGALGRKALRPSHFVGACAYARRRCSRASISLRSACPPLRHREPSSAGRPIRPTGLGPKRSRRQDGFAKRSRSGSRNSHRFGAAYEPAAGDRQGVDTFDGKPQGRLQRPLIGNGHPIAITPGDPRTAKRGFGSGQRPHFAGGTPAHPCAIDLSQTTARPATTGLVAAGTPNASATPRRSKMHRAQADGIQAPKSEPQAWLRADSVQPSCPAFPPGARGHPDDLQCRRRPTRERTARPNGRPPTAKPPRPAPSREAQHKAREPRPRTSP